MRLRLLLASFCAAPLFVYVLALGGAACSPSKSTDATSPPSTGPDVEAPPAFPPSPEGGKPVVDSGSEASADVFVEADQSADQTVPENCPDDHELVYMAPGCSVTPSCIPKPTQGCTDMPFVCQCNNTTTRFCNGTFGPFAYYGMCDAGSSGPPGNPAGWTSWPMPNPASAMLPNPASYTVNADGTVRDNVTRLVWQQAVDANTYTFDEAKAYCKGLALAGGGFRAPTRIELISLVDFTRLGPAIDTTAFPATPSERFWSSTQYAYGSDFGWEVSFGGGGPWFDQTTAKARVRCVR